MSVVENNRPVLAENETVSPSRPLRVVLAALYWEYGQKERGLSYEYYNLYLSLKQIFDVHFFDFYTLLLDKGKEEMNRQLLALIKRERPDLAIFALFQEEFIPEVIEELKQYTTTLGYFFDDMWRIEYAKRWVPRFNYVTTSNTNCLRRYRAWGFDHAIFSPFGYNPVIFTKKDLPKIFDVSFVGGFHGYRHWTIKKLRKAGINVKAWGAGWPAGRLMQEAMTDVFNQSKIALTLSNCLSWDARYLLGSPRWALSDLRRCKKIREQIKARHFEVSGCGSFQISYYVEDLERCFDIGREIVIYSDVDELVEKIRYYLKYEDEREAIAAEGYRRTIAEHSYIMRFTQIVNRIFSQSQASVKGAFGQKP
jgi:spore maturation protein CgeB